MLRYIILLVVLFTGCDAFQPSNNRFQASENGVILDTKTNLEWIVGANEGTKWNEGYAWVKGLGNKFGGGWRLPTVEELRGLYESHKGDFGRGNLLGTAPC